jgi:hypothetical protein
VIRMQMSKKISVGDVVAVFGIQSQLELNDSIGYIITPLVDNRYGVHVKEKRIRLRENNLKLAVSVNPSDICDTSGLFAEADCVTGQVISIERAWTACDAYDNVSQAWCLAQRWIEKGPPSFSQTLYANQVFTATILKDERDKQLIQLFMKKYAREYNEIYDIFSKCVTNHLFF